MELHPTHAQTTPPTLVEAEENLLKASEQAHLSRMEREKIELVRAQQKVSLQRASELALQEQQAIAAAQQAVMDNEVESRMLRAAHGIPGHHEGWKPCE